MKITRIVEVIKRVTAGSRVVRPVEKIVKQREVVNQTFNYLGGNYEEELSGVIDGINKVFTTSFVFVAGTTRVYVNGLKEELNVHYTETASNEITFDEAPSNTGFNDILTINYLKDS